MACAPWKGARSSSFYQQTFLHSGVIWWRCQCSLPAVAVIHYSYDLQLILLSVVPGLTSGRQSVSFNVKVERDGQEFSKRGHVTWNKGKQIRQNVERGR